MTDKQLEIYYLNILKFSEAISVQGGAPFVVLRHHHEFIEVLSRNGIEINVVLHSGVDK